MSGDSGSARLMYTYVSSVGPIVEFVIVVELKAVSTMVYGFFPPVTLRPQGWHVVSESVTFGVITGTSSGAAGRQEVLDSDAV